MITLDYIKSTVSEIHIEVLGLLEIEYWKHPLTSVVIQKMAALGSARIDGMMFISDAFIGTEMYDSLNDTIRHELAHLAVGNHNGHNAIWKKAARVFGASDNATASIEELDDAFIKNTYKYVLKAELKDGTMTIVRHYKKRTKKWLNVDANRYKINGKKVERFILETI